MAIWTSQAVVDKLRHNYVRLAALQSQLLADAPASTQPEDAPQQQSALKHFIGCTTQGQQYLDTLSQQRPFTNGKHKNGQQAAFAAPSSLFLQQLQQEVERLRRFVHSSAEDLWMRLLATADGLGGLKQTASSLQSHTQQHQCLLQHQELVALCGHIGEQQAHILLQQMHEGLSKAMQTIDIFCRICCCWHVFVSMLDCSMYTCCSGCQWIWQRQPSSFGVKLTSSVVI